MLAISYSLDLNQQHDNVGRFKLPPNYTYKILDQNYSSGDNFTAIFRIAEVKDEEYALDWINAFQKSSNIVWRVARTRCCEGIYNIFRKDFRCQHKTDKRGRQKGIKKNKNTDCIATLKLTIERYFDLDRLKPVLDEVKQFPCKIELSNIHNHELKLLKNNFLKLTPFDKSWGSTEIQHGSNFNRLPDEIESAYDDSNTNSDINRNIDTDEDLRQLEIFFNRIKKGHKENPELFKPAISKMIMNAKHFASDESGLISAMNNFGTYPELISTLPIMERNELEMQIQPTGSKRKSSLPIEFQQEARPVEKISVALKEHQYTQFVIPVRTEDSSLNLTSCVYKIIALGKNSSAK